MVFQPEHIGLYFGQAQIDTAQKQREDDENLQTAWRWLLAKPEEVVREITVNKHDENPTLVRKPTLSALDAAVVAGVCYRFADDEQAGQKATVFLESALQDKSSFLETVMETIAAAHIYEMLRPIAGDKWRGQFAAYVATLSATDETSYLERTWLMTLNMVAAIVLDDEERFSQAVKQFQHIIDYDIHPEGYIKPVISPKPQETATFKDMLLTVAALALAAEAATQAGVDLWAYEKREVGLMTVAPYLVYYYFYPEKWHWKDTSSEEETRQLLRQYGAFIEMVAYRGKPRGVEMLLEEERPLFSGLVGGLTTLTHGAVPKRKRRWFEF
ncbi:MAG: alginate lyase family protein [Anaerolineae bacterium]|nr:alginate lyase family protein [Anaerolineae bacterium]